MKADDDRIQEYSNALAKWEALTRKSKILKRRQTVVAIQDVQDLVPDILEYIKRLSDENEDKRILAHIELSKFFDPSTGHVLRRLKRLVEVTKKQAYDPHHVIYLKTFSSVVLTIIQQSITQSAKGHFGWARKIWENELLPMCWGSPEDYAIRTKNFNARLDFMGYILENCAKSIRRSAIKPPSCSELKSFLSQFAFVQSRQTVDPHINTNEPIKVKVLREGCTTNDLSSSGISRYEWHKYIKLELPVEHTNQTKSTYLVISSVSPSNIRKGRIYSIAGHKYTITHPYAIAFIDHLLAAHLSTRKDKYVWVPAVIKKDGSTGLPSNFHPSCFNSKMGKSADLKASEFWRHFVLLDDAKKETRNGQRARLGISKYYETDF